MTDFNFPIVVTANGVQPQDPSDLRAQLVARVAVTNPGYTDNLPGSMIEDIASTDVAAMALMDSAWVELVNSLTPDGANQFLLIRLARIYGVPPNQASNTSVFLVFSGTVGYVIPAGFLVSDGANVFQVLLGGVIGGGGVSSPIAAVAILPGTFGVPANTVNRPVTSFPSTVALTVNNPTAGTPGGQAESVSSWRTRTLQAGLAACSSSLRGIKTFIGRIAGVQKISVQATVTGPRVIVAGGDPYQVAYAIFRAVDNPAALVGSHVTGARNVAVSLIDPPNIINIVWVNSPQQSVTVAITWNTNLTNFTGGGAFPALVQPPLVAYINALQPGAPINILAMSKLFEEAVSNTLDSDFLTRLVFAVSINGTPTPPGTGTQIITGDDESYFFTAINGSGIGVTQG